MRTCFIRFTNIFFEGYILRRDYQKQKQVKGQAGPCHTNSLRKLQTRSNGCNRL